MDEQKNESFYDFRELIEPLFGSLEVSLGPDGDNFWVGGPVENLKDDQTLGEYKKEIIIKLNNLGFNVNHVEFICEAWRDG